MLRPQLLEGTLLKACRSKDKAYMFWLFSDALLYATQVRRTPPISPQPKNSTPSFDSNHPNPFIQNPNPQLPGGLFQLHRWMALSEMNVAASAQEGGKTGLDILTAEKSFTVFAKDEAERDMWLRSVGEAVVAAKEAAGVSTDPAALQVAPVLVQTSDSNDCGACVGACLWSVMWPVIRAVNPPVQPVPYTDSHLPAGLHALHAQAPLHVLRPRRLRQVLPEPVRMQSKAHTHTDDPIFQLIPTTNPTPDPQQGAAQHPQDAEAARVQRLRGRGRPRGDHLPLRRRHGTLPTLTIHIPQWMTDRPHQHHHHQQQQQPQPASPAKSPTKTATAAPAADFLASPMPSPKPTAASASPSPAKPAQVPSWLAAATESAGDEEAEEPSAAAEATGNPFESALAAAPAPAVVPAFDAFDGLAPHTPAEAAAKPQAAAEQEQAVIDPFDV